MHHTPTTPPGPAGPTDPAHALALLDEIEHMRTCATIAERAGDHAAAARMRAAADHTLDRVHGLDTLLAAVLAS